MKTGDPYKILGVQPGASQAEIRRAYRLLVKKYHPDRNPAPTAANQFMAIQAAYEQLLHSEPSLDQAAVAQKYKARQQQYDQDLEAYRQKRAAAREKIRQQKQREEAYKMAYLQQLKSGRIGLLHRTIAYAGLVLTIIIWIDFFLPERHQPIVPKAYSIRTYGSINNHLVQLFESTDGRAFWVADYLSQNLQKVQQLHSVETPWLHQVKALRFHDGLYEQTIPVHFGFYWAQIGISLLLLLPFLAWYFASADIIFVAGSFISRYAILALLLWFLISENRFVHLFTLGQL
ncbi:MAG: hypothetical protein EB003_04820 [Flavobacteriia bacterium]|jgi:hypothetical protein|nr:hypothetical protein [Flavobacteriia bacterium]